MMWAGRMSRVAHIVGMSGGRSQVDGRAGERYRDQLRVIGVDKRRIQRIFLAVRRTSSVSGEHWTGRRSRRLYIGSHASGKRMPARRRARVASNPHAKVGGLALASPPPGTNSLGGITGSCHGADERLAPREARGGPNEFSFSNPTFRVEIRL